jgi:hypothetical protein
LELPTFEQQVEEAMRRHTSPTSRTECIDLPLIVVNNMIMVMHRDDLQSDHKASFI